MPWRSLRLDRNGAPLAALLLIVLTAAVTSLVWWSMDRRPAAPPAEPESPPAETPAPDPRLGRAQLIDLAGAAASAYGAGASPPDQSALVGRPFELRIPFACGGPDLTLTRDDGQKTLKLSARPQDWTASPIVSGLPADRFERVEGFWIPQPWIREEGCRAPSIPLRTAAAVVDSLIAPAAKPASKPADAAATAPPPAREPGVIGLANFFEPGASRIFQRNGKPYETVQKIDAQAPPGGGSDYFLVIQGRVGEATPGRPVVCHARAPDRRPVCLVAVEVERVAFTRAGVDKPIAEWRR